jgi:hypothetical protein
VKGGEPKTLPVYGPGLPTKAVQKNFKDIYNAGVPPELISSVTRKIKGLAGNGGQGRLSRSTL